MKEIINLWLKQSQRDFLSAKHCFKNKDYYLAAWMCHQSIEKGLKALYLAKYQQIWKIHNLVELAKKVDAPEEIGLTCSQINPVYLEVRYPDMEQLPASKINKREAESIIAATQRVLQWIKNS